MTYSKKASLLATIGGVILLPAAAMAGSAGSINDVVKDTNAHIIRNTFNNCVVTKWTVSADECGGAMASDVRKLTREQLTVYFDFNRSTLNMNEKKKLDGLAKLINKSKEVSSVDIVGFTDSIGKSSYNKSLSTRRAETVKSFLASKGLKTRKVRIEGKGASDPVTSCDAAAPREQLIACLAADRRAEIELNFVK